MSREQKLIFTRHGKYTLWEKLSLLPFQSLNSLYIFVFDKKWVKTAPAGNKEYAFFLFNTYEKLGDKEKRELLSEIDDLFYEIPLPKNDFNGLIYQYNGQYFSDIEMIENLNKLKDQKIRQFEIDQLTLDYFYHHTIENRRRVLDLRFSSFRNDYYKQNINDSLLHTEIRVYLDCNISLVTNFSDYTHSESQKQKFINESLRAILRNSNNYEPTALHDHSLRSILLVEQTLPSKLKFEIEGRITVGVDIKDPSDIRQTIEQEEVKALYDKYPISHVKVVLSKAENKVLLIDGNEGKLVSRNKTLETKDIDDFVYQLKDLLKYDYLNMNHTKEIFSKAKSKIISTDMEIEKRLRICFVEVNEVIKNVFKDDTGVFRTIVENTYYYCLINKIDFVSSNPLQKDIVFEHFVELNLSKVFSLNTNQLYNLLKNIIGECESFTYSLKDCLDNIDKKINRAGMIKSDIGA